MAGFQAISEKPITMAETMAQTKKTGKGKITHLARLCRAGQGGEMMGMVIIVVLIIVIIGIYISFASNPNQPKNDDVTNVQNEKLIRSMLQVTVCNNANLEDIIESCSKEMNSCGMDSCELLEQSASQMLESTLGKELDETVKKARVDIKDSDGESLYSQGYAKLAAECPGTFIKANVTMFPNIGTFVVERCIY